MAKALTQPILIAPKSAVQFDIVKVEIAQTGEVFVVVALLDVAGVTLRTQRADFTLAALQVPATAFFQRLEVVLKTSGVIN